MRQSTGPPVEADRGIDSTRRGIVRKKTMEKASKLVEVIRACHVNILLDLYLRAFWDRRYAKDDNRNVLTESALLAYPLRGCEELFNFEAQAHEDQIRRLRTSSRDRIFFVPRQDHTATVSSQHLLYQIPGFLYIVQHKDDLTALTCDTH